MAEKPKSNFKVASDNRKARYNYEIGDKIEAGLVLTGTEVKSLRTGKATIAESYASVDHQGEMWLINATIPEYGGGNRFNHEPKRPRKLLLKQREIGNTAETNDSVLVGECNRLVREIARRHHQGPLHIRQQNMVQGRVRQHDAHLAIAWRHGRRERRPPLRRDDAGTLAGDRRGDPR